MPLTWAWVALLLGAVSAGAAAVALLVAPPRIEAVSLAAAGLSAAASAWGLSVVAHTLSDTRATIVAAFLGLAAAAGGYWLASSLLPLLARPRRVTPLTAAHVEAGRTAYVLLSRAEPERYRPRATASAAVQASEPGSLFVPSAVLPFVFAATKGRYRMSSGQSPARETVRGVATRLTRTLQVPEVPVAWCEPPEHLAETVKSLALSGCARIVVGTLGVAPGRPEELARRGVAGLEFEDAAVSVAFAEPLWDAEVVAELVAARVTSFAAGDEAAGVVLALDAQPPAWEITHPEFDAQVAAFAGRVSSLLAEAGIPEANVRTGWTDWRSPDVTETVRHLAALGCTRIAVVPAVAPTESLATMLDLGRAASLARTESEVRILPPWGNDQAVAVALAEAMRTAKRAPGSG